MFALGGEVEQSLGFSVMPRVVKRSASLTVKAGPTRRSRPNSPLPVFVPPQLFQLVEKPPSGRNGSTKSNWSAFAWPRELTTAAFNLLTRTGLDWTAKYPSAAAALANVNVKTAYLHGELCGVDDTGLPSFAHTEARDRWRAWRSHRLLRLRSLAYWR